ncbi:hypothetical protein KOR42_23440 [Thalassoglobus neptunius]|uniref:Uncharacterized protein n=1 Tax=Thalassoglobus neptunius TaxID=1938619 RepID=A0A5C5X765_9PLAN|nr:hypothetical protein [Thalassoglobus neptunius]TWT58957.1 hypothetical protein KOR42_23440 [Thalassoglobus neptunius]
MTVQRDEPNPEVMAFLERAVDLVAQQPEWQKGLLEASSRSTNQVPRSTKVSEIKEVDVTIQVPAEITMNGTVYDFTNEFREAVRGEGYYSLYDSRAYVCGAVRTVHEHPIYKPRLIDVSKVPWLKRGTWIAEDSDGSQFIFNSQPHFDCDCWHSGHKEVQINPVPGLFHESLMYYQRIVEGQG